ERALLRLLDIGFDPEQPRLADLQHYIVQELQQHQVIFALVTRAFGEGYRVRKGAFDDLERVAYHECAECAADDDQHLGRMPEEQQMAAADEVSADDASQHDQGADDLKHPYS